MIIIRDYQRKGKYILPQAVYHTAIWRIRDYYRIKKLADDIISENNAVMDGMPKTNSTSDTVAQKVIKRDRYLKEIENIDSALLEIPQEYRNGVWNNIQFRSLFPNDASRATYGKYKSKFIYIVSQNLKLI